MEKGWFIIEGLQEGDRTVDEQLTGLGLVEQLAPGRSILDFGCAEGLISRHLVGACKARSAVGLSLVKSEIERGRALCEGLPIMLHACNLDDFAQWRDAFPNEVQPADIVLLLSILHKLQRPLDFLARALSLSKDTVAIRLPGPVIRDARSGGKPWDVPKFMRTAGFKLVQHPRGPRREWLTIWQRG